MAKVEMNHLFEETKDEKNEPKSNEEVVKEFFEKIPEDSSLTPEQEEGFQLWMEKLNSVSPEERSHLIIEQVKTNLPPEEGVLIDKIVELLNDPNNSDKNTDLVWIHKELQKINPEINELTTFYIMTILVGIGVVNLDM